MEDVPNSTVSSSVPDPRSTLSVVVQASSLAAIDAVAVFGNVLILLAVSRTACLQTKTNVFIANLAVADLLLALLAMPFTLVACITYEWPLSDVMCSLLGVFNSLFCEASILTLTFVSLERFVAISYPLQYHSFMTDSRVKGIIVFIWVQALLCATSTFLFSKFRYLRFEFMCTVDWSYSPAYSVCFPCLFLFMPLGIVCVLYCLILKTTLDQQRKINALTPGHIERGRDHLQASTKRDSKDKTLSRKQERKATLTIFVVVGTFGICWVPHAACLLGSTCDWNDSFFVVSTWLAMLNSAMNFFIYGFLNSAFRKAFIGVLFCRRYRSTDMEIFLWHQRKATNREKTAWESRNRFPSATWINNWNEANGNPTACTRNVQGENEQRKTSRANTADVRRSKPRDICTCANTRKKRMRQLKMSGANTCASIRDSRQVKRGRRKYKGRH